MGKLSNRRHLLTSLFKETSAFLCSIIAGFVVYFLSYGGFDSLRQKNINFMQGDNVLGLISQMFFLSDHWRFPLGVNPTYGIELSTPLSITGGNLIILFRLLNLSPNVQLFGISILVNLILQHFVARKILQFLGLNFWNQNFLAMFFFTPFFLFRLQMHPLSVALHWPLLWAFLIVMKARRQKRIPYVESALVTVASYFLFINTWFLVILILLIILTQLQWNKVSRRVSAIVSIRYLSFLGILTVLTAAILDGFIIQGFNKVARTLKMSIGGGFGTYNFNWLSFFNPDTGVRDKWYFKPDIGNAEGWSYNMSSTRLSLGMTYGSYEGYVYLGLGILFISAIAIFTFRGKQKDFLYSFLTKPTLFYLALILLYASSGIRIAIGNLDLFLPSNYGRNAVQPFVPFRSSGRAMFIFAYAILIGSIWIIINKRPKKFVASLLYAGLLLQMVDLAIPLQSRYVYAAEKSMDKDWRIPPPSGLKEMSYGKKYLRIFPVENHTKGYEFLGLWSWYLGLQTNAIYSARTDNALMAKLDKEAQENLCEGTIANDEIYAVQTSEFGTGRLANCNLKVYGKIETRDFLFLSKTP